MRQQLSFTINFDDVFGVFLLLSMLVWFPGMTQNGVQFIFFDYGALVLFGLSTMLPARREVGHGNILLIIALCVIGALLNNYKAYPVGMIHLISGCLLYVAAVRNIEKVERVIFFLILLCAINMFFSVLQCFGIDFLYDRLRSIKENNETIQNMHFSMPGLMARNYHLAYILTICTPLAFLLTWQIGIGFTLASLVIIFLVKSYAVVLAFSCMALFLFFRKMTTVFCFDPLRTFIAIVLILAAVVAMNFKQIPIKLGVRKDAYMYVMREAFVNPFKGNGIGSFEVDANLYGDAPKFSSSYNQYLRLAYELGLFPVITIFVGAVLYFKKVKSFSNGIAAAIVAILAFPMFHEVMRFARLDLIIIAVLSIFEVDRLERERSF